MEDLLWDFDDVTTPQDFVKERYTALQAATRAFALELTETSKRFRPSTPRSPTLPGAFPPLPPLPLIHPQRSEARPGSQPTSARRLGSSVTVSEDSFIHIGREQADAVEQALDKESKQLTAVDGFESSRKAHMSWLLPDSSAADLPNPSITPAEEDQDEPLSSPTVIGKDRVPSWSETSNDKYSVTEGSIRSTKTNVSGSTLDTVPALCPVRSNIKQDVQEPSGSTRLNRDQIIPRPQLIRKASLTIGPKSSYHRHKGICQGGVKFRKDGHWESIVKTSEFTAGAGASGGEMLRASDGIIPLQFEEEAKIGRCGECSYAHDLDEMERDANLDGKTAPGPSPGCPLTKHR